MKVYRTRSGLVAEDHAGFHTLEGASLDELLSGKDMVRRLTDQITAQTGYPLDALPSDAEILPPVGQQEVWAAGVTYYRSRTARMEESEAAGGGSFYDRVYGADRPEIFFKAPGWRVVGPGGNIRIRRDSKWNVPEPELALVIDATGQIVGYTVGNDVSSRDIEGENPLYLPQAKCYDGACALGPCMLLSDGPLPENTPIQLEILRGGKTEFSGETALSQMKRKPQELVDYLYRETSFPHGAILLTGTGIVPDEPFTLTSGDEVRITIPPIGTLINRVG